MKTKLLVFAILVIALVGCQQHMWKEFSSPEGQFSLLMPGIPVEGMDMINTPAGAVTGYTFSVEQEEFRYVVGYADYPKKSPSRKLLRPHLKQCPPRYEGYVAE